MSKKIKLTSTQRFLLKQASKIGISKKELEIQRAKYLWSNKLSAKRRYYTSPLGLANLRRQQKAIYNKYLSDKWNTLSEKQKRQLAIKSEKLVIKFKYYHYKNAKTKQFKKDAYEDYLHAKYKLRARKNEYRYGGREFNKTYYIKRSTEASYRVNNTTNTLKENWIVANYGDELQQLLDDGMDYNQAIEKLFNEAINNGDLQPLKQGEHYGYIDEGSLEVISPV